MFAPLFILNKRQIDINKWVLIIINVLFDHLNQRNPYIMKEYLLKEYKIFFQPVSEWYDRLGNFQEPLIAYLPVISLVKSVTIVISSTYTLGVV